MTSTLARFTVFTLMLWSAALSGQSENVLTAQEKAQGWQLLFDGKTFKGWHSQVPPPAPARGQAGALQPAPPPIPGQFGVPTACTGAKGDAAAVVKPRASHWEVVDGQLIACGEPTGYLTSDQSFKNFVLSVEFKTGVDTNSGVFVRSPNENDGYEVQIWRRQPVGYNTGGIVNTAKTAREYTFKADQWNHYQITADGDHIVVVLNGETTLDIRDAKFPDGHVRLQYQQFPIAFRNIKIRSLP